MRIPADASLSLRGAERAEARPGNLVALLRGLGDHGEECGDGALGIGLADTRFLCDRVDQLCFGHVDACFLFVENVVTERYAGKSNRVRATNTSTLVVANAMTCVQPPTVTATRVQREDRRMTTPRIAPVTDPSEEILELYERGGMRAPDGSTLNIFATLANHPRLLKRWMVFAAHVMSKNTLSPRHRELAILRVGVLCQSPYEFGQHVVIAERCEISATEIDQVRVGPAHPAWSPFEAALLRAVDELHERSRILDQTWADLAAVYTVEQMLDLVFTIGQYHLVSFALNSCGVELDDGIADVL